MSNSFQGDIIEKRKVERADSYILDTLKQFYLHFRFFGREEPLPIVDKYRNPNPLRFHKAYSEQDILLTHYMLNEGLLSAVIKEKRPLLIKGSITQKGVEYLMTEQLLKI